MMSWDSRFGFPITVEMNVDITGLADGDSLNSWQANLCPRAYVVPSGSTFHPFMIAAAAGNLLAATGTIRVVLINENLDRIAGELELTGGAVDFKTGTVLSPNAVNFSAGQTIGAKVFGGTSYSAGSTSITVYVYGYLRNA